MCLSIAHGANNASTSVGVFHMMKALHATGVVSNTVDLGFSWRLKAGAAMTMGSIMLGSRMAPVTGGFCFLPPVHDQGYSHPTCRSMRLSLMQKLHAAYDRRTDNFCMKLIVASWMQICHDILRLHTKKSVAVYVASVATVCHSLSICEGVCRCDAVQDDTGAELSGDAELSIGGCSTRCFGAQRSQPHVCHGRTPLLATHFLIPVKIPASSFSSPPPPPPPPPPHPFDLSHHCLSYNHQAMMSH